LTLDSPPFRLADAHDLTAWLSLARRHPEVAAALFQTFEPIVTPIPGVGPVAPSWPRSPARIGALLEFARTRLDLHRLANGLESANIDPRRALRLARARVIRLVALAIGRGRAAEDSFWGALVSPEPDSAESDLGDQAELSSAERDLEAEVIADRILALATSDPFDPDPSARVDWIAGLDRARREYPLVEWSGLLLEASSIRAAPAEPLTPADLARLSALARAAAFEREQRGLRGVLDLPTAAPAPFVEAAATLLTVEAGDAAIWLGPTGGTGDVAIAGALTAGVDPEQADGPRDPLRAEFDADRTAPARRPEPTRLTRLTFERTTLPGSFRWSRRIPLADAELAVYLVDPPSASPLEVLIEAIARQAARVPVAAEHSDGLRVDPAGDDFARRLRLALGEFSAGAGHEINNPLGAIAGQAGRLLEGEADPDRRHSLRRILDQVERIKRMIRDLQLVGRRSIPEAESVDLDAALDRAAAAVAAEHPGVTIQLPAGGDNAVSPRRTRGTIADVVRLLTELFRNAASAAGEGGRVEIRWGMTPSDSGPGVSAPLGPPGVRSDSANHSAFALPESTGSLGRGGLSGAATSSRHSLETRDSGPGFRDPDALHAGTPYYCGRGAGRRLGMGLAVSRRIADDFGFDLWIEPLPPTRVFVSFPRG
jgi:signal transduction histidine kinase